MPRRSTPIDMSGHKAPPTFPTDGTSNKTGANHRVTVSIAIT